MTNEIQETGRQEHSSLPALHPVEATLRLRYFAYGAVPSTILLDYMSQGQFGASIALGAVLGGAAAYFAPEIHKTFQPALHTVGQVWAYLNRNNSGRARHRLADMHWWLTGEQTLQYAEEEEESFLDADAALEEEELADGKLIDLAADLKIPATDIAGKAIFIAGIRRSGKTTLGVRIAEQMSQYDLPLFVPDLEGDWLSAAATTFKCGRILAHPSAAKLYADVEDFVAVTVESAELTGFNILDEGAQAVLDMASYPSIDEACQVAVKIIRGLFVWTEHYADERVPCQVYLDEAQRFLPQSLDNSIIEDKLVRQALLKAYMDIIAIGGKRGLSPVILTQRFSQVNKKIMAQSEVFFLLRQTNDNDLKRCMEYVNNITATPEEISQFAQGEGVYIAATGEQRVTQFSPRKSNGQRGATPTVDAAERYARRRAMKTVPVAQDDDELQGKPLSRLRSLKSPDEILLERGVQAYRDGATSLDKLMAILGITQHKARQLRPRIEEIVRQEQEREDEDDL